MRKFRLFAAVVAVMILSVNSYAQPESFATLSASYNPVTFTGSLGKFFAESEKLTGFSVAFDNASPLSRKAPIYIDYGLSVQYSYGKQGSGARIDFLNIKLPVNFMVDIPLTSLIRLTPYAGVNGNCYALGQFKADGDKIDFFNDKSEYGASMNRFGCNWQAGARLYLNAFMLGFAYEGPITNLYGKSGDLVTMKTHQLNISLGFRF